MYKTLEHNNVRIETCCFSTGKGIAEYHAALHPLSIKDSFIKQLKDVRKALSYLLSQHYDKTVSPVFKRYFLSDAANQAPILEEYETTSPQCAVSVVQQPPLEGGKMALWVYLKSNVNIIVSPCNVSDGHNGYRHCWTAGRQTAGSDAYIQTESIFQTYAADLEKEQYCLENDCIRTWLFVQQIDKNYSDVVKARKNFFERRHMTEQTHYIVSTGIEGRHTDTAVLVRLDAYAVKGLQPEQIKYLYASTHFNLTHEYGVTFERGVCVDYGDRRHVFIAGTASINNRGEIVHPNDIVGQTYRMLENIEALLIEAEAGFEHLVQMIVYLRDLSDFPVVNAILEKRFRMLPKVITLAPVCRPGWLIETECIAIKAQHQPQFNVL
jgi:enamine deaminase RidA (YjgF/YER057c/UK114 family)